MEIRVTELVGLITGCRYMRWELRLMLWNTAPPLAVRADSGGSFPMCVLKRPSVSVYRSNLSIGRRLTHTKPC